MKLVVLGLPIVLHVCVSVFLHSDFLRILKVHTEFCSTCPTCVLVAKFRFYRFLQHPESRFLRIICVMKRCGWVPFSLYQSHGTAENNKSVLFCFSYWFVLSLFATFSFILYSCLFCFSIQLVFSCFLESVYGILR